MNKDYGVLQFFVDCPYSMKLLLIVVVYFAFS